MKPFAGVYNEDSRLFDAANKPALNQFIDSVPQVGLSCIELRLSEEDWQIDYQICPFLNLPEFVLVLNYLTEKSRQSEHKTSWRDLRDYCNRLYEHHGFRSGAIPNIWLVYDNIKRGNEDIVPWIYTGLPDNPITNQLNFEILKSASSRYPIPLTPAALELTEKLNRLIPPDAYICAFGHAYNRGSDHLRIAVKFSSLTEALSLLRQMGWPGEIEMLEETLRKFFTDSEQISLAMDLGDQLQPVIGIEKFVGRSNSDWPLLLTHLPTYISENKWYNLKKYVDSNLDHLWLNHIKFVFSEKKLEQVKGYLFCDSNSST
ncbi:MAG: hypothetical protein GC181_04050 [Bacteroidetes bacterium]|nr:hypothetical protein [Bacteroidota bacterium]